MHQTAQDVPGPAFSVLDLSPIVLGGDATLAFRNSLDLAQNAECLGFKRYWLAEHHNMPGIASAATSLVISHVAAGTKTIRVGSGGVMLPNHAPLVIAEQFGTLASLYPGRIDLGVGRAPGTDQGTARALRRYFDAADRFPQDVVELQSYFRPAQPGQAVRAVPGSGLDVPIWILGSSVFGAQLAGLLGLPFAFAAHFAPDLLMEALQVYRGHFKPSERLTEPYALVCVSVIAADTDDEARRLFTSQQQQFLALRRGTPGLMPPPLDDIREVASESELAGLNHTFQYAAVGGPATVRARLEALIRQTQADEIMAAAQIFDHKARVRSYEILADVRAALSPQRQADLAGLG
jgi:luciferase family oxidoreductase group 1